MESDPASSRPRDETVIRTARLTIRPLRPSDVGAMHAVYSDPEAMRFVPGGIRDWEGTSQRVAELIAHHERHGVSKWAVVLSSSGLLVGDCGLQFLPGRTELELGFHIARSHWGHGYATEAAHACLSWAIRNRSEPLVAIVDPAHHASQHILSKVGMKPIGRERLLGRVWLVYKAFRQGVPGAVPD